MSLLRSLFWFALFVASTFCFVVLFEHGFSNFGENSKKEIENVKNSLGLGKKAPPAAG